ncbi:MAG: DUF4340 domain-containing protein [Clostridiales bacterium]|nr:DUF4340 domain-containing protein [Clostridiales bacterium]
MSVTNKDSFNTDVISIKKRIIASVALIALVGGVIVAIITLRDLPPPDEYRTQPEQVLFTVIGFDAPIVKAKFNLLDGASFTLIRLPGVAGEESGAFLEGHEDLPIDASRASGILAPNLILEANQLVRKESYAYESFGLDEPQVSVTITDANGVSKTLLIGDLSPDGSYHYVQVVEETEIYLVLAQRLFYYMLPETGYLDRTITSGSDEDLTQVQQIVLGGLARKETGDVIIAPHLSDEESSAGSTSLFLYAPVHRPLDNGYGSDALSAIFGLKASDVIAIYPDEEQIAEFGMDYPYATLHVNGKSANFTLMASEPDESGYVLIMREDMPIIYSVNESDLPWLSMQFYEFMDRSVYIVNLEDVHEIILSSDTQEYVFTLDHSVPTRVAAYIGGVLADYDDFMSLIETLSRARYDEYISDQLPEWSSPYLRVTFRNLSGAVDKIISFYPGPPRKYYVDAGDMDFHFLTASYYVDTILAQAAIAALTE